MSAPPLLEVRGLTVHYGEVQAVVEADLSVQPGTITGLVGPSGCGKTSLLRTIAGFETPTRGTIRIAGEVMAGEGTWVDPEHRRIGMVFQEGALFPHLDVSQNVAFGLSPKGQRASRVAEVLQWVGLAGLERRYPDQLSGGQRQRVALARSLAPSPRLVLLDEPFASLDASRRGQLREQMRDVLRRAGATAVLVTHDQEEALSVSDALAVMLAGRIRQCAGPEEIYSAPETPEVAGFIGEARFLHCEVRDGRLECALGTLDTDAPDGAARLLLRPEDLRTSVGPGADPAGELTATIARRTFLGQDTVYDVELGNGSQIRVRGRGATTGSKIRLQLSDPGHRFRLFCAAGARWAWRAGDQVRSTTFVQ